MEGGGGEYSSMENCSTEIWFIFKQQLCEENGGMVEIFFWNKWILRSTPAFALLL